jgi:flagellar biosynthetic protein FliR
MISISSQTLIELVTGFLWPLTRILGVLAIAPPFGNSTIPMRIKLMLGVSVAMVVSPMLPKMPEVDPVSLSGMVITAQQLVIALPWAL